MPPAAQQIASAYRAPWWLPGGHAQTLCAAFLPPSRALLARERWDTPDGDFIDVDFAGPVSATSTLVLFHGLEGGSNSHYARALAARAASLGWRCALPHFRGCSGEPNRLPRAYHSGDSDEIDWILRRLRAGRAAPLDAVGVSLGGNALLKWLGERGTGAGALVRRAVAVSAPIDLAAAGFTLDGGFNRELYTRAFLATMKRKALAKLERFPGLYDAERVARARTLYEFDDLVTAPLHGFSGVRDYWSRASSAPWLERIRVPTLLLNALNDPFLPAEALLAASRRAASDVVLEFPATGGHAGFPARRAWLAQRIDAFLSAE
jgi:predicted alpha/beta-fold hydrolase